MSSVAAHVPFLRQVGAKPVERNETLEELLAPERWLRKGRSDPELKKAFGFIQAELGETRRLLADATSPRGAATADELRSLLVGDVQRLSIDGAWELHGALKRLNLRLGDPSYVAAQLDYERCRPTTDWHGWGRHFDPAELRRLIEHYDDGTITTADHRRAVDRLTVLYLMRAEAGRDRRARAALKCGYLHRLAPLLFLLVVALGTAFHLASDGKLWRPILLTATAGALGSTLSGVFKVRDHLARLDELRGFWPTMRVQPLTGACAGLIVLLVLESKAIAFDSFDPNSPTPAALGLLAFAAGFSEPFFLGIIQKVAVIPDPKTQPAPKAPAENPV